MLKQWLNRTLDAASCVLAPVAAGIAAAQARLGPERLPWTYRIWDALGLSPVRHHYYQPVFAPSALPERTWDEADTLSGVDLNTEGQLALLRSFDFNAELEQIPVGKADTPYAFFHNTSFGIADAEALYNMVRRFRPRRVIEIGSGYSTRMMKLALDRNRAEGTPSTHECIEPYEMPWLEALGLDRVIRQRAEDVDPEMFAKLRENDLLFIDSSHVLRLGGDVYAEYCRILPRLAPGVLVHIHDIFLPYHYPRDWVVGKRRYWTEQYVLQAFLACNREFEVLLALNYLALHHPEELTARSPVLARGPLRGHGSFWIRRKPLPTARTR